MVFVTACALVPLLLRAAPQRTNAHARLAQTRPRNLACFDCEMWVAWGVSLEIWRYSTSGYTKCPDCVIAYSDQSGTPDATLQEFKAWNLAEAEIALPAHDFALLLRDTLSKRIVSGMLHVELRAGTAIALVLAPLSQEQFAALPEPMGAEP